MSMLDTLKDYSIVYSFDRSGFARHARQFSPIEDSHLIGKRYLVTGGTSGIGAALAQRLAEAGAEVLVTGRSRSRFEQSGLESLGVGYIPLDMADFHQVMQLKLPPIDGLVCNAGGMPGQLQLVNDEFDQIFASQVVGHYLLMRRCIESGLLTPGGSLHFTSSGGMYLKRLDLDDLCWQEDGYDKVKSYANAKRAQVILNEELARRYPDFIFSASHPGWVGTQALQEALPGFARHFSKRLRSDEEGADTIYWCLCEGEKLPSGEFWFDRQSRPVYAFPWTRESYTSRQRLMTLCATVWAETLG
ncbi:SDR family NAD(P)-dependent oxidoreductase [Saccharospirillum mangrovi]|uniref:SDR family NAD(P)-dependent oxidoreductase n=1 Tax=Saccharospirillum mangrovi TaxID=2161747 RepID=UPI000D34AB4C|nr:SDR family NAD(P)-dependent oxidoreductase [Saccharospirillum mangrovi]